MTQPLDDASHVERCRRAGDAADGQNDSGNAREHRGIAHHAFHIQRQNRPQAGQCEIDEKLNQHHQAYNRQREKVTHIFNDGFFCLLRFRLKIFVNKSTRHEVSQREQRREAEKRFTVADDIRENPAEHRPDRRPEDDSRLVRAKRVRRIFFRRDDRHHRQTRCDKAAHAALNSAQKQQLKRCLNQ